MTFKGKQAVPRTLGNSPFTLDILAVLAKKIKLPSTFNYNSTIDPTDHTALFATHMELGNPSEATCCKHFPATLFGIAQTWFQKLTLGTIDSSDTLSTKFLYQTRPKRGYLKPH